MDGGEIVAEVLKSKSVEHIFTLCGGHISPLLVGAEKHGIQVIDVRQESTAVFAADAIARLTGNPGVAVVTAGPGVTNCITAVKNAQMAQSPLILLGGAVATVLKGKGALQDIEQIELFKTLSKWAVKIEQNYDIVPILEEAFNVARSGIPGPIFIECPIDILYSENLVRFWYRISSGNSKSLKNKAINWYLHRHVDKIFACDNIKISNNSNVVNIPFSIDQTKIQKIIEYLKNAAKPVLIVGSQALLRVNEVKELVSAIERIKIPVFLTGMARGLLGVDHKLHLRHSRSRALKSADLVILAGMPMDFRLDYGNKIGKRAKIIAINRSKKEMKKNRIPDFIIQADPSTFLQMLAKSDAIPSTSWEEWLSILKKNDVKRDKDIESKANLNTDYINPLKLCKKIDKCLGEKSFIIVDGGDFIATASYIIKPRKYLNWLDAGPFGTLGAGAGFALAAKLVNPGSEVWLLYGDGAAGYSIIELDTFVRHNLPIIAVIGNDAGWTQIQRDQVKYLQSSVGTTLTYNDYHLVANGLGSKGFLIDKEEQLEDIIWKAKKFNQQGNTVLINALIGKTNFRDGSISM